MTADQAPQKPIPVADQASAPWFEAAKQHRLLLQRCDDCDAYRFPAWPRCDNCWSINWHWATASGKGTVFSYVVHHAPKVPGRTLPFVIALVELEEGVRMLGELRGIDASDVKIGLPVRATYLDFPDSDVSPAWSLYAWEVTA